MRMLEQQPAPHGAQRVIHLVLLVLLLGGALLAPASVAQAAVTMTVTTTADTIAADGACSLREALEAANLNETHYECVHNGSTGTDTIKFAIPGSGAHTIAVTSGLPVITQPVFIDGWSQGGAGYSGAPLIEIDGSATDSTFGLNIQTSDSTVRGLSITAFPASEGNGVGIGIFGPSASNNWIYGNYLGLAPDGSAKGNGQHGIWIGAASNIVGTNADGNNDSAERNVISANASAGVRLRDSTTTGNLVRGNYIGTDPAGTADLGNGNYGVWIGDANGNTIGGTSSVSGNLISGNNQDGIRINDANADNTIIQANRIGTNAAGTAALGNGSNGIYILSGATNTQIGGLTSAAGNLISGNRLSGVLIDGTDIDGTSVQGNYIGTNAAGTAAIPNGDNFSNAGIRVGGPGSDITTTQIGGTTSGARNVISGNRFDGIAIWEGSTTTTIQGNSIGLGADGETALGNNLGNSVGGGIAIRNFSSGNLIGGTDEGAANRIANNQPAGIRAYSGTSNRFRANEIYNNLGLGIDIQNDGVDANDPDDYDSGANNVQNYPLLDSATSTATGLTVAGSLNSSSGPTYQIDFFSSPTCDPSGNGEGSSYLGSTTVDTGEGTTASFNTELPPVPPGQVITAVATSFDGDSSEFSACRTVTGTAPTLDNGFWTRAYPLTLSPSEPGIFTADIQQALIEQNQSAWFKFTVKPGARISVALNQLAANYDLTLYKNIADAYVDLTSPQDLLEQSAEFAPDYLTPDYLTPDYLTPDYLTPDYLTPDYLTPDYLTPDYLTPDYLTPDYLTPDYLTPDYLTPEEQAAALSNAQRRSLLAYSALEGTADELVSQNTWENDGEFYVRVRGREGVFNPAQPFNLQVTLLDAICASVAPPSTPRSLIAPTGDRQTIILTDFGRMPGSSAEIDTLLARLNSFAARPEVKGVIVNVGSYSRLGYPGDARVIAANTQADANPGCPYAKNLVTQAIKDIIDDYREKNPIAYVMLIGGDGSIPYARFPEQVGLGEESTYDPPVRDETASQASLKLGYVLTQDRYGARVEINSLNRTLPIPDLPVGRLVETASEATGMLDAYLRTVGGVLPQPKSALVTGYDFLTPGALAVRDQLEAGLGRSANSLISARDLAPTAPPCDPSFSQDRDCNWTANDLRTRLLGSRHDVIFLAGHFSQGGALAGDYRTRLSAAEVAASTVDLENSIVFSAGCHSGYNTVDGDLIGNVTSTPDWAQAAARKRFTLIAGTGYQYGDTEVIEYGARLYLEFSKQLRTGSGPVAVGKALVAAKNRYMATTPNMRGIHDKTVLQATLYGFPMLAIDMPGTRLGTGDSSIIGGVTPAAGAAGAAGLASADATITPSLTTATTTLTDITNESDVTATYLSGNDGVVANPNEPVLPLEVRNVSVAGRVLRGVGFRSANYSDSGGITPLIASPATELRNVRSSFSPLNFFPVRPWNSNYITALNGGATRLLFNPAQFQADNAASASGTLRRFTSAGFRFFYSTNFGDVALAGAPSIGTIESFVSSGNLNVSATVVADPNAETHEVWVTYTGVAGSPLYGQWRSFNLSRNASDPTRWEGLQAVSGDANAIRFIVQAVNYSGLVTLDTKLGAYYRVGAAPPPPVQQATTLSVNTTQPSGPYAGSVNASAQLRLANGAPISGQPVVFTLGNVRTTALTGSDGVANASLQLFAQPGAYELTAGFTGTASYAPAGASTAFTINKLATSLSLSLPGTAEYGEPVPIEATLTDSAGRAVQERTVYFVVSGPGGPYERSASTDYQGRAALYLALGNGSYSVQAYFSGNVPLASGTLELSDTIYQPASASRALTIADSVAPDTSIDEKPANPSGSTSALFSFSGSDGSGSGVARFECKLDSGGWATCSIPAVYPGLSNGSHTFMVRAIDAAGNVDASPASYTWTISATTPVSALTLSGTQKTCGPLTCFINKATVILGANESAITEYRLRPPGGVFGPWKIYRAPFDLTAEGSHLLEYRSTDGDGNLEPARSATIRVTYLGSTTLDVFNGRNGSLSSDWSGSTNGYQIIQRRVHVSNGGPIYWQKASFGSDQQAFVTLSTISTSSTNQSLLLKVQGGNSPNWNQGAIRVRYNAVAGQVVLETYRPAVGSWVSYTAVAVSLANGDQLGARVRANGEVWLYRNCERIATITLSANDQSFFNGLGGRIGLWWAGAANAYLDDFGGGNGQ